MYVGCLESIRPFRISREPVTWHWCNLAVSQRRPYCASVNSHSPMGLFSRQWDAANWPCVLCDQRIHNDQASSSASSWQCACPFYSSCAGFLAKLLAFPKAKTAVERKEICECDRHPVHNSVNSISMPTDQPYGRVTVHGCTVWSSLTGCQVTSRPCDRF